jgi:hypothetical protein
MRENPMSTLYERASTLGQNCQMFVSMRAKKTSWDKTAIFLSVWRQKKTQPKNKVKISGVTLMENDLLFCSILKLMFTNGKIIVYKFMIQFYSYLYFCQSYR